MFDRCEIEAQSLRKTKSVAAQWLSDLSMITEEVCDRDFSLGFLNLWLSS